MAISSSAVKELRERTGAGMLDCKQALEQTNGDVERAVEILRERGVAVAAKKAERQTGQGLVQAYIHHDGRYGALVELNCETDFVARTEEFRQLASDIAMQVAALNPRYISREEVPPGEESDPRDICLLAQPFIKDNGVTIDDLLKGVISKTGENVRVSRFVRYKLGGGTEPDEAA